MNKAQQKQGEILYQKSDKISIELVAFTYGTFVARLLKENENAEEVNIQLEQIGENIGKRLIDEFLAKSKIDSCKDFKETADVIGKTAFKMYLGIAADVTNWNDDMTEFSLIVHENPLAEFVMLPTHLQQSLWYSNVLCGIIKGALEMLNIRVSCKFVKDKLRGNGETEIIVTLHEIIEDRYEDDEM